MPKDRCLDALLSSSFFSPSSITRLWLALLLEKKVALTTRGGGGGGGGNNILPLLCEVGG